MIFSIRPDEKLILVEADSNRIKVATKSQTGTGLGMFISKSIIEAHGGKIWAKNNSDTKGAIFTFTLPVSQHRCMIE